MGQIECYQIQSHDNLMSWRNRVAGQKDDRTQRSPGLHKDLELATGTTAISFLFLHILLEQNTSDYLDEVPA